MGKAAPITLAHPCKMLHFSQQISADPSVFSGTSKRSSSVLKLVRAMKKCIAGIILNLTKPIFGL
jgi:hypothetical protein